MRNIRNGKYHHENFGPPDFLIKKRAVENASMTGAPANTDAADVPAVCATTKDFDGIKKLNQAREKNTYE